MDVVLHNSSHHLYEWPLNCTSDCDCTVDTYSNEVVECVSNKYSIGFNSECFGTVFNAKSTVDDLCNCVCYNIITSI